MSEIISSAELVEAKEPKDLKKLDSLRFLSAFSDFERLQSI